MKAIKKNFENLKAVANRICFVPTGNFSIYREFSGLNAIRLVSKRNDIGYTFLKHIPCNYRYRITFYNDSLELLIWFN